MMCNEQPEDVPDDEGGKDDDTDYADESEEHEDKIKELNHSCSNNSVKVSKAESIEIATSTIRQKQHANDITAVDNEGAQTI